MPQLEPFKMKIIVLVGEKWTRRKTTENKFSFFNRQIVFIVSSGFFFISLDDNAPESEISQLEPTASSGLYILSPTLWPTPLSCREGMPAILEFNLTSFAFSEPNRRKLCNLKCISSIITPQQPRISCLHQRNLNILFNDMFMFTILCCCHRCFITTEYKHSTRRERRSTVWSSTRWCSTRSFVYLSNGWWK